MGHGHDHGAGDAAVSRHSRRLLNIIAVTLAIVTVVGVAALWPRHSVRASSKLGLISKVYAATVVDVRRGQCGQLKGVAVKVYCTNVKFRLTDGPDRGHDRTISFSASPSTPHLARGDKVVLSHIDHADPGFDYTYNDRQRRPVLTWLFVLFGVAVIALGRWRGVAALAGLGASLIVILVFLLPSMLDGNNPQLVAIVGASAVAYLALYLANGFRPMTTVALLGTLSALTLTVVLATVFTNLAHFTGAGNEDALLVKLGTSSIDLKGLVLAGMVLGALGALNDITVTQASAVGELYSAHPEIGRRQLYRSGLRIGRDHISSTVNTLALAYAGASLPLLILFSLSGQSLGTVANGEVVAVEIVSTLVGSIGLVAAVPLSTWYATLVVEDHHSGGRRRLSAPVEPTTGPGVAISAGPDQHDSVADSPPTGTSADGSLPTRRERRTGTRRASGPASVPEPEPEDLLAPRDPDTFWER